MKIVPFIDQSNYVVGVNVRELEGKRIGLWKNYVLPDAMSFPVFLLSHWISYFKHLFSPSFYKKGSQTVLDGQACTVENPTSITRPHLTNAQASDSASCPRRKQSNIKAVYGVSIQFSLIIYNLFLIFIRLSS